MSYARREAALISKRGREKAKRDYMATPDLEPLSPRADSIKAAAAKTVSLKVYPARPCAATDCTAANTRNNRAKYCSERCATRASTHKSRSTEAGKEASREASRKYLAKQKVVKADRAALLAAQQIERTRLAGR